MCRRAPALAQTAQERRWCEGEEAATPDQRIAGCSAVIRAGRDKGEKLAEAFNNRGLAYRSKDDSDRAIQDYSQAIRINPKFASAYNNRGVAYDHKGDYDRAIQDYEQAIRLMPGFAQAYFNRGNAYLGKSQYAQAIDDYNQAIRLKPDFAAAFDNRCWARAVVGILQKALADCNEALRLMPNNAATLDSRGFVFLKMTQFDAAVSDYDAALAAQSKPRLGALWARHGEIEERGRCRRRPTSRRQKRSRPTSPRNTRATGCRSSASHCSARRAITHDHQRGATSVRHMAELEAWAELILERIESAEVGALA